MKEIRLTLGPDIAFTGETKSPHFIQIVKIKDEIERSQHSYKIYASVGHSIAIYSIHQNDLIHNSEREASYYVNANKNSGVPPLSMGIDFSSTRSIDGMS